MASPPDRADVTATAVLAIVTDALRAWWVNDAAIDRAEVRRRVADRLRDEFDEIERRAGERSRARRAATSTTVRSSRRCKRPVPPSPDCSRKSQLRTIAGRALRCWPASTSPPGNRAGPWARSKDTSPGS